MGIHLRRFTAFVRLSQICHSNMKLSLALFLVIVLVAILYPEDSDASPALRRRTNAVRAARARAFRARQGKRVGGRRKALRRGRTNPPADAEAEAPPAPEGDEAVEGDEAADAGVEGEEAAEVPAWCDPATEMGAWLNYASIRTICGDRGFTDFGPYGGVPAAEEGAEEGDELLKVALLKKWKKPLKKSLLKNAAGGVNFALADSETERIKFVLNLFCFVLQGETFCLNLKLAIKNKNNFPIHQQSNKISHHVIQCILIQFLQCVQNLCKLRE